MDIYISSGNHFYTDVEGRIENIEETIGEPDAIFLEDRIPDHTRKEQIINWIAAPILLVSLNLWLVLNKIVSPFLKTDSEIVAHFNDEYGLEPYQVDKPVHKIIGSQSYDWGLANWSLLVMPVALIYFPFGLIGVYFALFTLITGAISVTIAYLSAVHGERNVYIMSRIAEIAENDEYEKACIITGGKHDSDLRELANRFDGVNLVSKDEI